MIELRRKARSHESTTFYSPRESVPIERNADEVRIFVREPLAASVAERNWWKRVDSSAPVARAAPDPLEAEIDTVLEGSVGHLERVLDTGKFDGHLDKLEAKERAGKNRRTALAAIADRRGDTA